MSRQLKDQVKVIAPTVIAGTEGRVRSKERKVIVAGSVDFSWLIEQSLFESYVCDVFANVEFTSRALRAIKLRQT